jgi:hypothetical protein
LCDRFVDLALYSGAWKKVGGVVEEFLAAHELAEIPRKLKMGRCENGHPETFFVSRVIDPDEIDSVCPICRCDIIPSCPEHGHTSMILKCCYCCSIAVNWKMVDGELTPLCPTCVAIGMLRDAVLSASCTGLCRFAPHHDDLRSIVGRCQKCDRVFSYAF